MINFTYRHITQNLDLENFITRGITKELGSLREKRSVRIFFYREFTNKNRLKEVTELITEINGESIHILGKSNTFKKSAAQVLKKFELELKNAKISPDRLQSA